jgi:CHAT domain-containing protein
MRAPLAGFNRGSTPRRADSGRHPCGASARSVIAAVGYIEPGEAQELAVEFFRRWLGGNLSKAAALQQAQLKMHENQTGACPISWASYMLIGDYR